ncbi:voltage-dependent T-type calcium channel subunit alpha-1G-like isoform X2 [Mercenaria mercenaria]|uniref:voltage-dependent T-type calcium channel subunit alpha-1G-like isoform X2 n=1 Tax=Mercenaria mercenaria TaxID=6596 RepID=UPI00234FA5B8|nr:voltage-dependent T-type calcium channel subunit alpha-1G-like isoform X2 [Mercenaria mercenaria]
MCVIILNCVTLGMYQPCNDNVCDSVRCRILQNFDHFIFAFFAVEMIIKITAMGFWGKTTYLEDSWNRLDMFIVLAGTLEYGIDSEHLSLSAIRTIRVLRPLRAINRIPSMRILVMLLLDTLPMLGNVLLLCFFVFFIFGIIGVQLWAGVLRNRCFINISDHISYNVSLRPYYVPMKEYEDYICARPGESGMRKCENLPRYQFEGIKCNGTAKPFQNNTPTNSSCVNWNQYYTVCDAGDKNPFQGAISFDNIGLAWVAIFQVISLESWVNIMYYVQDAHSFWDWSYFVALIVIGSFFMINLCLVVIATQFSETKKRETERMLQERKRYQSTSTLASNSEPSSCYTEILKYIGHLYRRGKRKLIKLYYEKTGRPHKKAKPELILRKKKKKGIAQHHHSQCNHARSKNQRHAHYHYVYLNHETVPLCHDSYPSNHLAPRASPEASEVDPISSPRRPPFLTVPGISAQPSSESLNTLAIAAAEVLTPSLFKSFAPSSNQLSAHVSNANSRNPSFSIDGSVKHLQLLPDVVSTHSAKNATIAASNTLVNEEYDAFKFHHVNDKGLPDTYLAETVNDKFYPRIQCALPCDHEIRTYPCYDCDCVEHDHEFEMEYKHDPENCGCKQENAQKKNSAWYIREARRKVELMVEHRIFQRGILAAILFNTFSMGIEYHNQPEGLTRVLEYSNYAFATLFAIEMFLKLISYGLFGYIKNGFNVFDGVIVILSLVELLNQDGGSGLSVLRTFRLLRILKLVRFMPALQRQLIVMLRTMDNVATFFALLLLFMFIFSVLGMNLFGGKFCWKSDGSTCNCNEYLEPNICECDRANFNTLLWSLVTVFQVLTQEDWNTVLYNGMEKTSAWAALYFVALMTFGNYVLFNLLVAILVEGFSSEEEEKKKRRDSIKERKLEVIMETNNNEQRDSVKEKVAEVLDVKINNKEKEKMLGLNKVSKDENNKVFTLPPPVITHTEATPMATPQGSPNEHSEREINMQRQADTNSLTVEIPTLNNVAQRLSLNSSLSLSSNRLSCNLSRASSCRTPTVSFRTSSRMSARVSPRPSPRPSPRLWRSLSYGSRRNSWKMKRTREGDKAKLMKTGSNNDNCDDDEYFCDYDEDEDDEVFKPASQPILKPNGSALKSSECNGGIHLNNQRVFSSHQNLMFNRRMSSPKNSLRSRNNSSSSARSICNSIHLSRQNTFPSRRKIHSLSSTCSGHGNDDYRPNNLSETGNDREEDDKRSNFEEEDPDAIDETNCNYSWCPEPHGCFLARLEYSMYLLSPDNPLRRLAFHIIAQKWFDNTVLFFIALNCITLAMERPDIPPDSVEREFLSISNHIFTVIFTLEMLIKVIAKGLMIGKHAYLKSGWNIMDGFLVAISLIDTIISMTASSSPRIFGILRVFRLLRTLRPLRVISRAPGLKLVVQTLLSSLRPIGNIVLICCTFFIIFGILGVQLFKGTFYYCKGPNVTDIKNKTQCLAQKRNVWINQKYNFDNLGQALMALFVLASKDGWVSIMYTGLDAVGVDQQPIQNYNEWRLIFFISFLLLVGFFVLNMFVGVVVENFHKCRESQEIEEKARRAEKRQQKLDKKRRGLQQCPYWAKYGKPRLIIYTVINSKYFDLAIAGVIGLNVITMALEFYMMPKELEFALQIFNYFFTSVFILEAAMKIIALGTLRYLRDRWNQLDIFIVILSIVGIVLEEMKTNVIPINPTIIRVMRVLRIARVLKLLKMAKGIRALLDTVIQALPQVGNLGLLFFLLFFIFAALGVELFGRLECSEEHPCEGLGVHAHFRNFGMAFLTLFRVATGDNWNGIMKDTLRTDCDNSDNCLKNCCVNYVIAPVYFVVFVLMAQFVLVNVVVAVLMKHLEETYKYKELDDEVEEELKMEMDVMRRTALRENYEMAKIKDSHKVIDDEVEIEALFRKQVREYTFNKPSEADDQTDKKDTDTQLLPPPSFTLRPPSCEPCPPSPTTTLWAANDRREMFLDPMAITINVHNDNNTLKVPSISSMDGRMSPRDRLSSDSSFDEGSNKFIRSAVSTPTRSMKDMQEHSLMRPVSDQQINLTLKERKEKAVSWHSKIPSSTQTLGCVEGVNEKEMQNDKHTQSQPLLGTLESNSSRKHICRHTYSVKQVRTSAKDWNKSWSVRRCASSGNEKSKFREKYLHLRPTNKVEDYNSSVSLGRGKVSRQPSISKTDSVDNGKGDEMSLIDWDEDEKLCDEEVGNITGNVDDDDGIRPTISYSKLGSDINLSIAGARTPVSGSLYPNIIDNHSKENTPVPKVGSLNCDYSKSDSAIGSHVETGGSDKEPSKLNEDDSVFKEPSKQYENNLLLSVPTLAVRSNPMPNEKTTNQLQEGTLLRPLVLSNDERRPPIQSPRPAVPPLLSSNSVPGVKEGRRSIPRSPRPRLKYQDQRPQSLDCPSVWDVKNLDELSSQKQERQHLLSSSLSGESHL